MACSDTIKNNHKMTHVAEYKKRIVNELTKLISDYPVTAVVSVENVPALQLQKVRAQIRDNVVIIMSKRRLIKLAFDKAKETKKGIEKLKEHLKGMPALMFTKENPFKLAAMLIKSKSKAPAKAGQTAPNDITIEAGPTSFAPGPIIGELGQLGIKTKVEDGKIAIKENMVLVKKGEKISEKAAAVLTRLGIEPMEIGLMPEAAYENELIFTRDVLEVDEKEYINKLNIAETEAFNLAVEINYPVKEVVEMLIAKAFNEAKAVALEYKIIDKEIIDSLLGIAESEITALKESAGIEVSEKKEGKKEKVEEIKEKKAEVKEEKKEEVKAKETKEEVKKEKVEEPREEVKVEEKPAEEPEKEEKKEEVKEEKIEEDLTKKEEKIIEEEKEIIKEEVRLEKKEPRGAPVEKEVQEAVKEEEEKLLEKEIIEKEKELEKIEEEKEEIKKEEAVEEKKEEKKPDEKPAEEVKEEEKEEPKEEVDMSETQGVSEHDQEPAVLDKKIEEMVKKTKDFVEGKIPDAEKLIEETKEEDVEEERDKEKPEKEKEKTEKETPSAHDLAKKKKEKETTSDPEIKKKEEKERKDVEEIVKKLQRGEKI